MFFRAQFQILFRFFFIIISKRQHLKMVSVCVQQMEMASTLKLIYSERAAKFCEISVDLTSTTQDK